MEEKGRIPPVSVYVTTLVFEPADCDPGNNLQVTGSNPVQKYHLLCFQRAVSNMKDAL